jgi:hypothetical protein
VSWLDELIGFKGGNEAIEKTSFDFALVPDDVFCQDTKCPHCGDYAQPELIEPIENVEGVRVTLLGDLMMCTTCSGMYAVVEFPILPITEPIMTRWSVPKKK